ncbi:hypothetical protein CEP52_007136 [Fusarium oligoseptatum]|uniref:chitin synthase n=1 Tax=Fusarium oligoseptatum TaxID=2604345 RepID=A0A428TPF1_9HYPO|nr:hypothetical protein CEP52_007136 [Fusarium oligoseptatum]
MANRMSMYSMASEALGGGSQPTQVSTTTLLNAIHNIYLSSQPHQLDASTSLVVNTWLTAAQVGPTVDASLAARAWEHARRRAEDGCVILGSLHPSTPSLLVPFLNTFPFAIPSSVHKSLEAIRPFLRCVTPNNPSAARQIALGVTLTLNLTGSVTGATLALSQGGIDTKKGLLNIPAEAGYRAFDVFYYLLTSASTPAEREFLGLKSASAYALLARSGTYDPPSYLLTADDAASADDFRQALKEIGIKGSAHRNFISTLAGLLKLGNTLDYAADSDDLEEICEDVSGLLGMEPEVLLHQLSTEDRQTLVGGLYEALVDWVISKANSAISAQMLRIRDGDESVDGRGVRTPNSNEDTGDTVSISVIEVPDPALGKALAMRTIFDDTLGINAEMIEDGVEVHPAGSSVVREMQQAVAEVAPDLGIMTGPQGRDRQHELEKREVILEKVAYASEDDGFLKKLLFPIPGEGINLGRAGHDSPANLAALPAITSAWSAGTVSRQLRSWRLPEWANRRSRNLDYTADFDVDEFVQRYGALGCKDGKDGIETWMLERGWSNGEVFIGKERVWVREGPWWEAESMLDIKPAHSLQSIGQNPFNTGFDTGYSNNGSGFFPAPAMDNSINGSNDHLVHQRNFSQGNMSQVTVGQNPHLNPNLAPNSNLNPNLNPNSAPSIAPSRNISAGDYGLGTKGDTYKGQVYYNEDGEFTGILDPELAKDKKIETKELPLGRRAWVTFVWALTFWIPSPLLTYIGRMRRPDVRMAWREKLVLCFLIAILNGMIVFWIIGFGKLLCPNNDKAWTAKELGNHSGKKDFWVAVHGKVYDITDFWRQQHSDTDIDTTETNMMPLAGLVMDGYFPLPLNVACQGLGITKTLKLTSNETIDDRTAIHTSGYYQADPTSNLHNDNWYWKTFQPTIKEYYHGQLVWKEKEIKNQGEKQPEAVGQVW